MNDEELVTDSRVICCFDNRSLLHRAFSDLQFFPFRKDSLRKINISIYDCDSAIAQFTFHQVTATFNVNVLLTRRTNKSQ
jgi:hypothetical protein